MQGANTVHCTNPLAPERTCLVSHVSFLQSTLHAGFAGCCCCWWCSGGSEWFPSCCGENTKDLRREWRGRESVLVYGLSATFDNRAYIPQDQPSCVMKQRPVMLLLMALLLLLLPPPPASERVEHDGLAAASPAAAAAAVPLVCDGQVHGEAELVLILVGLMLLRVGETDISNTTCLNQPEIEDALVVFRSSVC